MKLPAGTDAIEVINIARYKDRKQTTVGYVASGYFDDFMKGGRILLAKKHNVAFDGMMLLDTPHKSTRILLHWETRFSLLNKQRDEISFRQDIKGKWEKLVKNYSEGLYITNLLLCYRHLLALNVSTDEASECIPGKQCLKLKGSLKDRCKSFCVLFEASY